MLRLLVGILILNASIASAQPAARFSSLGLPAALTKPRLEALLQEFVTAQYGRSFETLGDARDFDHGHILVDRAGAPVAILYHTHEDSAATAAGPRSWIQRLDTGAIEEAARYERASYPATATWDWFVKRKLPEFRRRGTVTEQMIDPARLDVDASRTVQWVFTRAACSGGADQISVRTPAGAVCLSLSAS